MQPFHGHHHLTAGVTSAKQDHVFHTEVLGLRLIKKTVIFAGTFDFYHLYYGIETGDESQLLTTFALGDNAPPARPGTGHVNWISLSVPPDSLDFWTERLNRFGYPTERTERHGHDRLRFQHPDGIGYELVACDKDTRDCWNDGEVANDVAIRGTYGVTISTAEIDEVDFHMQAILGFRRGDVDGNVHRYITGQGGPGTVVDFEVEPRRSQGSWGLGTGAVHHTAFHLDDEETQTDFKIKSEGIGYMDISDRKDRNYFQSVYFRNPSGALLEATYSDLQGFLKDESAAELGTGLQLPPWLEARRDELDKTLETIQ